MRSIAGWCLLAAAVQSTLAGAAGLGPYKAPKAALRQSRPLAYTGVNIAGGDFDHPKPGTPTQYGKDYIYPSTNEIDYFASKGMNVIRFPFLWEDLQPELSQPLNPEGLARIQAVVAYATKRGVTVILDPHNYARHYGRLVGGPDVPDSAFADFWRQLALAFKGNQRVWFGLVNEPHDLPAQQWLSAANAAIAAIRGAGAKNLILVPGISWTGAHSWISSGNGAAMLGVKDAMHHYIFDVHQYLDQDSSGTHPEAVSATIGSERLKQFTQWCRQHNQRGFLGEFASANNGLGAQATEDMLQYMEKNRDVWVGFTWWAAGAWWGNYMYSMEPNGAADSPLLVLIAPHLQRTPALRK